MLSATLASALAAASRDMPVRDILIWSAVFLGLLLLLGAAIAIARRVRQSMNRSEQQAPFTLDELRRMHREGRLSDEEYERTRRQIIGALSVTPKKEEADRRTSRSEG